MNRLILLLMLISGSVYGQSFDFECTPRLGSLENPITSMAQFLELETNAGITAALPQGVDHYIGTPDGAIIIRVRNTPNYNALRPAIAFQLRNNDANVYSASANAIYLWEVNIWRTEEGEIGTKFYSWRHRYATNHLEYISGTWGSHHTPDQFDFEIRHLVSDAAKSGAKIINYGTSGSYNY